MRMWRNIIFQRSSSSMPKMPAQIQEKGQKHSKNNVKKVSIIDFSLQHQKLRDEIRAVVDEVFESQQFILKERVSRLEQEVASALGVKHAVGVASGSDALYLSLWALGVGPNDEVITTP